MNVYAMVSKRTRKEIPRNAKILDALGHVFADFPCGASWIGRLATVHVGWLHKSTALRERLTIRSGPVMGILGRCDSAK
jgi:hypothetical protein